MKNIIYELGGTKLRALIASGILSASQLLQANPADYDGSPCSIVHLIPGWQAQVEDHYEMLDN
jgi:hypothetical protein